MQKDVYIRFTRSLLMMSILAILGRIYRYYFKCNYPKNSDLHPFYYIFGIYIKLLALKKNKSHKLSISEINDFGRRGYLNT